MYLYYYYLCHSYLSPHLLFEVVHSNQHSPLNIVGFWKCEKNLWDWNGVFKLLSLLFLPFWGLWKTAGNRISKMKVSLQECGPRPFLFA